MLAFSIVVAQIGLVVAGTASSAMCRNHPGTGFNVSNFFLNKQPLNDAGAKCNDGSDAQMFFRPCCNGEVPGDFCNESKADWFIVFGDGNEEGWCWDAASCARRAATYPQLTSSVGLPPSFGHDGDSWQRGVGAFAKGGEINPNFYKSYAAYIPYCSSDLFLGTCTEAESQSGHATGFCGKTIVTAAVKSLLTEMHRYGADNIVLVGGAGLMSYIEELRDMMPAGAKVSAVCDGCVLVDDLSSPVVASNACETAFDCTPDRTLPDGVTLWNAELSDDCGGWRCLLSNEASGQNGAVARAAKQLPLLAQQPQYDKTFFTARGLQPGDNASFAEEVRAKVKGGLAHAKVVVSSACTSPQSSFTTSQFYSVRFGGFIPPNTFATGLAYLVTSNLTKQFVDTCQGIDCNPDCNASLRSTSVYV